MLTPEQIKLNMGIAEIFDDEEAVTLIFANKTVEEMSLIFDGIKMAATALAINPKTMERFESFSEQHKEELRDFLQKLKKDTK